jgi:hypothetical protein
MNLDLIADKAELVKQIGLWGKRATSWVRDGQRLGLSVLAHFGEHSDVAMVNRLYLAMPKGTKSGSMAAWLLEFSSVTANTGPDRKERPFLFSKDKREKMGGTVNMAGAEKTPWQDCGKQEEGPASVDALVKVQALIKSLEKAENLKHAGMLSRLKDLVAEATAGEEEAAGDDSADATLPEETAA